MMDRKGMTFNAKAGEYILELEAKLARLEKVIHASTGLVGKAELLRALEGEQDE